MELFRPGPHGLEWVSLPQDDGAVADLSDAVAAFDPTFLAVGGIDRVRDPVATRRFPALTQPDTRIGPLLVRPGKVVFVALNYHDHAVETAQRVQPVLFLKAPDTVVGSCDEVLVPRGSGKTDWEVELEVVIGRAARYVSTVDEARARTAGYAVSHDVSERAFQLEPGDQWDKGKSCETFSPLGPWLVTADEIVEPQDLRLWLWVNGVLRQNGHTKDMVFGVGELVQYISQFTALYPGDLINTGTPAGAALGQPEPKPSLRAGDMVDSEIDGLGRQQHTLVAA